MNNPATARQINSLLPHACRFAKIIPRLAHVKSIYASGNKLEKRTVDIARTTKTTSYVGSFLYENNTLQLFGFEEGRLRPIIPTAANGNKAFAFDYFIKDHLGNTRMVLTDEQKQVTYPAATLEDALLGVEMNYYQIDPGSIVDNQTSPNLPKTYVNHNGNPPYNNNPSGSTTGTSQKMYKLKGGSVDKTGLGFSLKVMSGDIVSIFGKSYWHDNSTTPNNNNLIASNLLTFLNAFTHTAAVSTGTHSSVSGTILNNSTSTTGGLTTWMNNQSPPSNTPRAYFNWILFDEQFQPVLNSSGSRHVGEGNKLNELPIEGIPVNITKNGYLYVYCSNESNLDVFFDNFQVVHNYGSLLEESHYYPFGLAMAGISSKATNSQENKYKFNSGTELNTDFDLNIYETPLRGYDAQIGRFGQIDMLADNYYFISPYQFGFNNPIIYNDPSGALTQAEFDEVLNTLWGSPNGGHWENDGGGRGSMSVGGGSLSLFGSGEEAFGFAATYMSEQWVMGKPRGLGEIF